MISFNNTDNLKADAAASAKILETERRNPDCECRFALCSGCLIARIFDDFLGYIFTYPDRLSPDASEEESLLAITEYCLRENIPEIISEVPRDKLPLVLRSVRHAELHAMDASGDLFVVEIKNELSMLGEDFSFQLSDLELELPSQDFAEDYEALVRDREHNKYYGYEITDDNPDITAADMVSEALREFELRRALTLFVTDSGDFIGEAVLYNFDGRGYAEISFRVAREKTRRGYGRKILYALAEIAEEIGLLSLRARVSEQNKASLALLRSSRFEFVKREDGTEIFGVALANLE